MTGLRTCATDLEMAAARIKTDPVPSLGVDLAERDRIARAVRKLAADLRALDERIWSK